jgi:alpha 1,6-mannosyltransferase
MLTIRKLAFLVAGLFFIILFISRQSPTSPSLVRKRPNRTPPQTKPQETRESPSKSKAEIDRILDQANRPLKPTDDFPTLRDHLAYLFPYEGAAATKFPAYIWQTWKYTPAMGEFDEKFRITEASWTGRHPDYVHEVIPIEKSG